MSCTGRTYPHADTAADDAGDEGLSSPTLITLEQTWAGIRRRHPGLPAVVVVLAAGSIGAPRGMLRLGHFAAMRWDHDGATLPEVFVGGEGLARGPLDVLGTLLHEAAHALAHVRGIKDCSRQGRYHNRRYAALAVELGLDVAEIGDLGWSATQPTSTTAVGYAAELAALRVALIIHRHAEGQAPADPTAGTPEPGDGKDGDTRRVPGGRPSNNNGHTCACQCGRRIRVSPTVLAQAAITCGRCGHPFTVTR